MPHVEVGRKAASAGVAHLVLMLQAKELSKVHLLLVSEAEVMIRRESVVEHPKKKSSLFDSTATRVQGRRIDSSSSASFEAILLQPLRPLDAATLLLRESGFTVPIEALDVKENARIDAEVVANSKLLCELHGYPARICEKAFEFKRKATKPSASRPSSIGPLDAEDFGRQLDSLPVPAGAEETEKEMRRKGELMRALRLASARQAEEYRPLARPEAAAAKQTDSPKGAPSVPPPQPTAQEDESATAVLVGAPYAFVQRPSSPVTDAGRLEVRSEPATSVTLDRATS